MYTLKHFYCFLRKAKQYSDCAKGRFTNKAILAQLENQFSEYDKYYGILDEEWKSLLEDTYKNIWYTAKSRFIRFAIKAAKDTGIKVTAYRGVIYFETPTGQASFHDPKFENIDNVEYTPTQWRGGIGGTDNTINMYFGTYTNFYIPFN